MSFPRYLFRVVEEGASPAIVAKAARRKDINVNRFDEHGYTPLMRAAMRGNVRGLRALLAEPRINVNILNDKLETALMLAAQNNHPPCVKALLEHPKIYCNGRSRSSMTALEISIVTRGT